jgi:hypothetical protein
MNIPRSKLPGDIYAVNVTISLLVDGRGITEADRLADAKEQAAKWAGAATREVGEPSRMAEQGRRGK